MLTAPNTKKLNGDVLLVIGDASETVDTLYPYFRLQEAGFRPYVIASEKRLHQMVLHEVRPGWTITKEWEGYQIMADAAFADIDPENYQGIFSVEAAPRNIFATILTSFESHSTFSPLINQ